MQANSLKDLLQSKIDDLEKQVLSRVNSIEEGKPGLRNETEQRGRVESTLTSLHQRITDLEKGGCAERMGVNKGKVNEMEMFGGCVTLTMSEMMEARLRSDYYQKHQEEISHRHSEVNDYV